MTLRHITLAVISLGLAIPVGACTGALVVAGTGAGTWAIYASVLVVALATYVGALARTQPPEG